MGLTMTLNNIQKAIEIVNKYYYKPVRCKIYKNQVELIKAASRQSRHSYSYLKKYYEKYLIKNAKNYINSKYYISEKSKTGDDISALSGEPIFLNANIDMPTISWTVTLLHEAAHLYYFKKSNGKTWGEERNCDLYAIRWINKIKKINKNNKIFSINNGKY